MVATFGSETAGERSEKQRRSRLNVPQAFGCGHVLHLQKVTAKHDNGWMRGWGRTEPEQRLAAEAKDALDVAGEAALALLLHLLVQRGEGHVVEGQVEEERLAGHGLELWREGHQAGPLPHQAGVQEERVQAAAQRLQGAEQKGALAPAGGAGWGWGWRRRRRPAYRGVFHLLLRRCLAGLLGV